LSKRLDDLWFGNIRPFEDFLTDNPENRKLLKQMADKREAFEYTLDETQKYALREYDAASLEYDVLRETEAFKFGFRLARDLFEE